MLLRRGRNHDPLCGIKAGSCAVIKPDWIAVDWGTSNLRAWAMGPAGVLAEVAARLDTRLLTPAEFEPALVRLVGGWLRQTATPVICSGASWVMGAYRAVPCAPVDQTIALPSDDPRLRLGLVSGLKQSAPADVMQGEETQVAGALTLLRDFDGILCLPGSQSKWVHVSAGEVVSFQSFLTGDLFALLTRHLHLPQQTDLRDHDAAFDAALSQALSRPEKFAARLVSLRAEALLENLSPEVAVARLSGLLIGIELAAAKPYWLGQRVVLIGAPKLCTLYDRGLKAQGLQPESLDATACILSGLALAQGLL